MDLKEVEVKKPGSQQTITIKLNPKISSSQNSFFSSNGESSMSKSDSVQEFQALESQNDNEDKIMQKIEGMVQKKMQEFETKAEDRLTNKLAHFELDILEIKKQLNTQNEKVKKLESQVQKIHEKLNSITEIPNQSSPFNPVLQYPHFKVSKGNILKYIGSNWNQYPFFNYVMKPNQDVWCYFQIRLHNITNKKIAVGVVDTLSAHQQTLIFNKKNKNCLGYHLGNGKVIKGHVKGLKRPKGALVTMMINTHLTTIIWYGNEEELARQNWKKLKKTDHYFIPFIEMIHQNDEIEFVSACTGDVQIRKNKLQKFQIQYGIQSKYNTSFQNRKQVMQKHQEWLDNRQYQYHLACLTKIRQQKSNVLGRTRSNQIKSAIHSRRKEPFRHLRNHNKDSNFRGSEINSDTFHFSKEGKDHLPEKQTQETSPNYKKNKLKLTLKQKQLLLNNFLLGKRIVQTPSVINFRKNQENYKKQRKMHELRGQKLKNCSSNAMFRQSKLKQYQENYTRFNKNFRLKSSNKYHRYTNILEMTMQTLKPIKNYGHSESPIINDFYLKMTDGSLHKKGQKSEIINTAIIDQYTFYFGLKNKVMTAYRQSHTNKQNIEGCQNQVRNLYFQIIEAKGIDEVAFGWFQIQMQTIPYKQVASYKTDVYRGGKKICQVVGTMKIDRKNNITLR